MATVEFVMFMPASERAANPMESPPMSMSMAAGGRSDNKFEFVEDNRDGSSIASARKCVYKDYREI